MQILLRHFVKGHLMKAPLRSGSSPIISAYRNLHRHVLTVKFKGLNSYPDQDLTGSVNTSHPWFGSKNLILVPGQYLPYFEQVFFLHASWRNMLRTVLCIMKSEPINVINSKTLYTIFKQSVVFQCGLRIKKKGSRSNILDNRSMAWMQVRN